MRTLSHATVLSAQVFQLAFRGLNLFPFRRALSARTRAPDADVLVVGAGVAGVTASIAAAEQGASVVLLDRAYGGGASAMSGGVVYAGGGTDQQRAAGYGDDTPDNMFRYLREEVRDAIDEETLRTFYDESVARLKWLERHGARFEGSLCPYKTSYPGDEHYLYFSGNEMSHPYDKVAKPAPRGHRMASPGLSGRALWEALFNSAMKLGVRFLPASKVERILLNDQGTGAGIAFDHLDSSTEAFRRHKSLTSWGSKCHLVAPGLAAKFFKRADKLWQQEARSSKLDAPAVILSAGGFAFNPSMRQQYAPDFSQVAPLGTRADDGSGILLGQGVGGAVGKMDKMSAWRFLYPPTALLEGVVVSRGGHRFISEDVYGATLSDTMIRDHNSEGFLIIDSKQRAKAIAQLPKQTKSAIRIQRSHWLRWDHKSASSITGLAVKLGVDANELERTVGAYNAAIAAGKDDPLRKNAFYCTPILEAPFYGMNISPRRGGIQMVPGLTLGGLRVDGKTGLVLRGDKTAIESVYAAGRSAVGICSNMYVSGTSLADCVFSGKRAGTHAGARRVQ